MIAKIGRHCDRLARKGQLHPAALDGPTGPSAAIASTWPIRAKRQRGNSGDHWPGRDNAHGWHADDRQAKPLKGSEMPIITAIMQTTGGRGSRPVTEPARTGRGSQLPMLRWLADRRRVISMALAAGGYAATFAAAAAGSGHLGRVAAAQIGIATSMTILAMGEGLRSPACPVITDDRSLPGTPGRYRRLGTFAFVTGCMLGLPAGGAALGASWGTTLLTTLAGACAFASIAAQRLGRQLAPSWLTATATSFLRHSRGTTHQSLSGRRR
jgi:hypothetical protein